VEEANEGIKLQHSLQYTGDKDIKLEHQTPLVSVAYDKDKHEYAENFVLRELKKGDIYYQEGTTLPFPDKGHGELYIHAKFKVNGEKKSIKHTEKLKFQ